LPSEPKIFHGREYELSQILQLFKTGTPRIAILGAGGMGKTSLAKAVLHYQEITAIYGQHRVFVTCDSATSTVELGSLIGSHIGLKPGKNLIQKLVQYFSTSAPSLLILDELETLWEPAKFCGDIEELLSQLTGVGHLAIIITMRGAERPAKVQWTRPFLPSLKPLDEESARQTFMDISDTDDSPEEVNALLALTDNMPLAISLLAHLADSEGCSNVLARWHKEKTSLISEGLDRRSNLDLSISVSISSPRMILLSQAQELLSLLSMLPDGLLDLDLIQSKLPLDHILSCKAALMATALAYSDDHKRLKVLVPVREYMQKYQPPRDHLVRAIHKYFQELLECFEEHNGNPSNSGTIPRISSNFANIQNILQWGLQEKHSNLADTIYCVCYLNKFSQFYIQAHTPLIGQIHNILPNPTDHRLETYVIIELLGSWHYYQIPNQESLISRGLQHLEHVDEPDLKCGLYDYHSFFGTH
ncbi:P-loop containing nucleoside triphosphate hydrolase protein, partial [Mycena albidolilacea]